MRLDQSPPHQSVNTQHRQAVEHSGRASGPSHPPCSLKLQGSRDMALSSLLPPLLAAKVRRRPVPGQPVRTCPAGRLSSMDTLPLTCPASDATLPALGDRLLRRLAWQTFVVHVSVVQEPASASPVWTQAPGSPVCNAPSLLPLAAASTIWPIYSSANGFGWIDCACPPSRASLRTGLQLLCFARFFPSIVAQSTCTQARFSRGSPSLHGLATDPVGTPQPRHQLACALTDLGSHTATTLPLLPAHPPNSDRLGACTARRAFATIYPKSEASPNALCPTTPEYLAHFKPQHSLEGSCLPYSSFVLLLLLCCPVSD